MATTITIRNKKTKVPYEVTNEDWERLQANVLTKDIYIREGEKVPAEVAKLAEPKPTAPIAEKK